VTNKRTPITIRAALIAAIIGGVFVILGSILTPLFQHWLEHLAIPTPMPAPIATESLVVLIPTWVDKQGSVLILNNQVAIHQKQINYAAFGDDTVDISIIIGTETKDFSGVKAGERVVFQYLGVDYSVTVLQIRGTQIQISAERMLITK
jgi:hypothetical protein